MSAGAGIFAGSAHAALLAYEGFAQTAQTITAATPLSGSGFSSIAVPGGNPVTPTVDAAGLSYSNLSVTGGKSLIAAPAGNSNGDTRYILNLTPPGVTTSDAVTYLSFLLQTDTDFRAEIGLASNSGFNSGWGGVGVIRNAGVLRYTFGTGGGVVDNSSVTSTGSSAYTPHQTELLVFKIDRTNPSNMVLSLFVNPASLGGAEPGTPTLTTTLAGGGGNSKLESLRVFFNEFTGGANQMSLDEIRVGTTFADVTPVPEPGSMGLLVLGASLAMLRRRSA